VPPLPPPPMSGGASHASPPAVATSEEAATSGTVASSLATDAGRSLTSPGIATASSTGRSGDASTLSAPTASSSLSAAPLPVPATSDTTGKSAAPSGTGDEGPRSLLRSTEHALATMAIRHSETKRRPSTEHEVVLLGHACRCRFIVEPFFVPCASSAWPPRGSHGHYRRHLGAT